jgi:hypothetical protein
LVVGLLFASTFIAPVWHACAVRRAAWGAMLLVNFPLLPLAPVIFTGMLSVLPALWCRDVGSRSRSPV